MLLKHFNYISQSSFSKATKRQSSIPEIPGIKLIPFPQHLRVTTLPLYLAFSWLRAYLFWVLRGDR